MAHLGNPPLILVVDDEDIVRDFVVALLERKGYNVSSAVDGQEAVELFEKKQDCVKLLLTDLAMPRKNGIDLIREVKAINPELPVVAMSGHFPDGSRDLDGIPCISKPFAIHTLLRAVESELNVQTTSSRAHLSNLTRTAP